MSSNRTNGALLLPEQGLERVSVLTYVTDTFTLKGCKRRLYRDENERLVFYTGSRLRGVVVVSVILEPPRAWTRRKRYGVHVDPECTMAILRYLDQRGYQVNAVCHSHPFDDVPTPSGTDYELQRRLEAHGYTAVGMVFSRSAVRFFSHSMKFKVHVEGDDVKAAGDRVFLL